MFPPENLKELLFDSPHSRQAEMTVSQPITLFAHPLQDGVRVSEPSISTNAEIEKSRLGLWQAIAGCYASKPMLIFSMLISGGFFFRSGSPFEQHPLAFNGVRELHLAICFLFAVIALMAGIRRRQLFIGDVLILFVVLAFMIGSAIFAYLKFHQPIALGLLEERRTLAVFSFFFIMASYRYSSAKPDHLVGAIYVAALIYVLIALVMQAGLLGDLAARDIPVFDPRKHRILVGTEVYVLSTIIAAAMIIRYQAWQHMVPLLVGFVGLVAISQTRGAIAVVVVTIFAIFAWRRLVLVAALASVVAGGVMLWQATHENASQDAAIGEVEVRITTARIILEELQDNDWIGLGSLSMQWEDGFARIYNKHFFLSDVGVLGELYRLGALLLVIYGILALATCFYVSACRSEKGRTICIGLITYSILNVSGGGVIAFAGFGWAILFCMATAFRQKTPETVRAPYATSFLPRAPASAG